MRAAGLMPMALAAALCGAGCATDYGALSLDLRHPSIAYGNDRITMGGKDVTPDQVLDILEYYKIPPERTIHIRVTDDLTNLKPARGFLGYLSLHGYHRAVLVTERHAEGTAQPK